PASAAPTAGGTLPSNAALLGLKLADPDAAGARALTAAITDPNGNPLGTGTVAVPGDGWWVVGLTPGATTDPPPPPPVHPPPPPRAPAAAPRPPRLRPRSIRPRAMVAAARSPPRNRRRC